MQQNYQLVFDLSKFESLDKFSLLVDQEYNLGDRDDWFSLFRGGLYGLYSRLHGVQTHYYHIHAWEPEVKHPSLTEYHLSSLLFNMDSAIECMVFALNALGYIADSRQFVDITNEKTLAQISPINIIGRRQDNSKGNIIGHNVFFPQVKRVWSENRDLIYTIADQHDVSKHRSTIYVGGRMRNDPPVGFFKNLGIEGNKVFESLLSPMEEIILSHQPKTPWAKRKPRESKDAVTLEAVAERFCVFINECGKKALEDARQNIKLNYYEFKK